MNLPRDRFIAGSAFYVRTVYLPGGRQHRIFDRSIRWRNVARAMRRRGLSPIEIARTLRRNRDLVNRALDFSAWPFR